MEKKFTAVILLLLFAVGSVRLAAQTHFTFTANTGSNATVVIQNTASPTIDGVPLSNGDEIGAFSPAGLCVGACVWSGSTTVITVWGDDPQTSARDGMVGGESISYRIWDASKAAEYHNVTVTYSMGDGIFQVNGLYVVSSITATSQLPVELTSFTAVRAAHGVMLTWTTATEVNNHGFEIERSAPGDGQWATIGFTEGAGTSNAPHAYTFADRAAAEGRSAYRLKQIDRDGKFTYSQSVDAAASAAPSAFQLSQNFPNPFNPSTEIGIDLPTDSFAQLDVFDASGRHVAKLLNSMMAAGHYTIAFNGAALSGGIYFYRFEAGSFRQVRKMLLVK